MTQVHHCRCGGRPSWSLLLNPCRFLLFFQTPVCHFLTISIFIFTIFSPSEIRVIKSNINQLDYTNKKKQETVDDNKSKIKLNKTLPYLVSNVVEILDPINDDEESEAGAAQQDEANGKSVVVKTTTRQTIYLPLPGLVDPDELKPGDLIGTNKDSYIILETLPTEYDSRVKAMEIDEKPQEEYQDIGGCEKQIEELIEAVVLPMREAERFIKIGIQPPKGVLLWGPPGTGKTLLARACAKHTDAVFLKLAGPELVSFLVVTRAVLVVLSGVLVTRGFLVGWLVGWLMVVGFYGFTLCSHLLIVRFVFVGFFFFFLKCLIVLHFDAGTNVHW